MSLTIGSLFAGIGGFDLGFQRAGLGPTKWFVELNPFCQSVLAQHWPGVPIYSDIRDVRGSEVEPVDILCGGFPCQDISNAGKGEGITGARSSLWKEYARLVDELRPSYVVVENVAALRRRGLDVVLGDLSSIGYDAEWDCIRASDIGASHRRDRLWLVAYPECLQLRDQQRRCGRSCRACEAIAPDNGVAGSLADSIGQRPQGHGVGSIRPRTASGGSETTRAVAYADSERELQPQGSERDQWRRSRDRRSAEGDVADASRVGQREPSDEAHAEPSGREARCLVGSRSELSDAVANGHCVRRDRGARVFGPTGWLESADRRAESACHWAVEPDVGRVAYGVPARVDRLKGLGNALVPQIAEWIGHQILAFEGLQPVRQPDH